MKRLLLITISAVTFYILLSTLVFIAPAYACGSYYNAGYRECHDGYNCNVLTDGCNNWSWNDCKGGDYYNAGYRECHDGYNCNVTTNGCSMWGWNDCKGGDYYNAGYSECYNNQWCNVTTNGCNMWGHNSCSTKWDNAGYRECHNSQDCNVQKNACVNNSWNFTDCRTVWNNAGYSECHNNQWCNVQINSCANNSWNWTGCYDLWENKGYRECGSSSKNNTDPTKMYEVWQNKCTLAWDWKDPKSIAGQCGYSGNWSVQILNTTPVSVKITGDPASSYAKDSNNDFVWQQNVPFDSHVVPRGLIDWWVNNIQQTSFQAQPLGTCTLRTCNSNSVCSGSCNAAAPPNTCGFFTGTKGNCTLRGPDPCRWTDTQDQSCTTDFINNCTDEYNCVANTCVTYIMGTVFVDNNGNNEPDNDERKINNVQITLTKPGNNNETISTNNAGFYQFLNRSSGNYQVSITIPDGYKSTNLTGTCSNNSCYKNVNLGSGQNVNFPLSINSPYLQTIGGNVHSNK